MSRERGQTTDDRRQMTEGREQMTEGREQRVWRGMLPGDVVPTKGGE